MTEHEQSVEPDMSWFDIAVDHKGEAFVLGASSGWADFAVEHHWEDTFDCDEPSHLKPGAYRWSGFKIGHWAEDEHLNIIGGQFTPTPTPDAVNADKALAEPACANCKGLFGDLASGRDPEELCDTCYSHSQERTPAPDKALMPDAGQVASPQASDAGAVAWSDDIAAAPYACQVLAARFDNAFGEWVVAVVMSPPSKPFTHWRMLDTPATAAPVAAPVTDAQVEAWKYCDGPLPDYEDPLYCVFESGCMYAVNLLAQTLGVKHFEMCDGTEEFDGDLGGTLFNVVLAAMPKNADGDEMHPDEVRAALANMVPSDERTATSEVGK